MSTVVIGVNHRTVSVDLLEKVALSGQDINKAIANLVSRSNIREAAVLSTCNRTEVYAVAERFHGAYSDIREFLSELAGLSADQLTPHLYSHHDNQAVAHLFGVAAGLDSAVIGESEILGQVRKAWEIARAEGGSKATLNLLFRHAIETGKRARTETSISRGTASVSHAAVEMTVQRFGTPTAIVDSKMVVVGAGAMGEGIAIALHSAGATDIQVLNRTEDRARQLADRVGGRVVPFASLRSVLAQADVVLTCTGAGMPIIDADMVTAARADNRKPLLFVDVAVPRDVATNVGSLPGVQVLNLDDLRDWAAVGLQHRALEATAVRSIVADEVERFVVESTARQAAPLVAQLHDAAEQIRQAELQRYSRRLEIASPGQQQALDAATKAIIAKLLHTVSVRLKQDAGTPQGERNAAAVRELFDLE